MIDVQPKSLRSLDTTCRYSLYIFTGSALVSAAGCPLQMISASVIGISLFFLYLSNARVTHTSQHCFAIRKELTFINRGNR